MGILRRAVSNNPVDKILKSENLYNSNWCYCCTLINVNSAKLKRRMENKMHAHYPIAAP